jgi:putative cardiolipin synthase
MMFVLKLAITLALGLVGAIAIARVIFALPKVTGRIDSRALPPTDQGRVAQAVACWSQGHAGTSGIALLVDGTDAFAARISLADAAVLSIDAQYYIWRGDLTGYLMLDALRRAADRGVRVRLLLDDNGVTGLDAELAALQAHPNIEVRLYNPFNLRRFKALSYTFDFFRLNRRMHNKSFTVDGLVTIMGGRNIGNEYFDTGPSVLFVDLDVIAMGAVVPKVAADFDRYWATRSVHPAGPIIGAVRPGDPIAAGLARLCSGPHFAEYRDAAVSSDIVSAMGKGDLGLEWTNAVLVSDDPIKGQGAVPREDLLAVRLMQAVGEVKTRFDGVSPYLVPGAAGTRAFSTLQARGVQVRMLTNSLEATDVVPVHAGYAKRRRAMLQAGISLYELRAGADQPNTAAKKGRFGSSGASLHAKTFAVDGARIFVGSFNFDPRSTTLNTEMGVLIDSPTMANGLHAAFDKGFPGLAWKVDLTEGRKVWVDHADGAVLTHEPGTTLGKRMTVAIVGWLPVEWLL